MNTHQTIPSELLNRIARFGKLYLLDTVSSTSDYAFSLATSAPERGQEPAIVVARKQTKGRGRFRRHWFSDDDSLIFSILLFLEKNFSSPNSITQFAGLALCRGIERLAGGINPSRVETPDLGSALCEKSPPLLRWPNDLLIDGKKIAGILCEQRRSAVVVGVGINLNQSLIPKNLPEAASLFLVYHQKFDRLVLLEAFLTDFFNSLELLKKGATTALWAEVKNRSAIIHHRVEIRTLFRRYIGTVIDIDDLGRVVLRTDSGKLATFNAGQVKQLR